MQEVWLPIAENPDFGLVSNLGAVRGKSGKLRKAFVGASGYLRVGFSGGKYTRSVHTLVAEAFIGKVGGKHVNHKDCDKQNNRVENLEYVTPSENVRHAYDHGLRINTHRKPKIPHEDRHVILSRIAAGETQRSIASEYGVNPSCLCVYIKGRADKNYYAWRQN